MFEYSFGKLNLTKGDTGTFTFSRDGNSLADGDTGTLPAEVTSGTGCALRVESMYNRSGRIYAVIQTLYKMPTNSTDAGANAAVPAVYVRTNYCYRSATYTFTSTRWSAWKSIG